MGSPDRARFRNVFSRAGTGMPVNALPERLNVFATSSRRAPNGRRPLRGSSSACSTTRPSAARGSAWLMYWNSCFMDAVLLVEWNSQSRSATAEVLASPSQAPWILTTIAPWQRSAPQNWGSLPRSRGPGLLVPTSHHSVGCVPATTAGSTATRSLSYVCSVTTAGGASAGAPRGALATAVKSFSTPRCLPGALALGGRAAVGVAMPPLPLPSLSVSSALRGGCWRAARCGHV